MTNKILPLEDNAPKAVVVAGDNPCREALVLLLLWATFLLST